MTASLVSWSARWSELAAASGVAPEDAGTRGAALLALWDEDVPGEWLMEVDPTPFASRHRRVHRSDPPRPGSEYELEHQVLIPDPRATPTRCLDGRLLDGVTAFPLASDESGATLIEADMLLLCEGDDGLWLELVMVRTRMPDFWPAAVEALRGLRLLRETTVPERLFDLRHDEREVPDRLPTAGMVLAPPELYEDAEHVTVPTEELLRRFGDERRADGCLAVWDHRRRVIDRH